MYIPWPYIVFIIQKYLAWVLTYTKINRKTFKLTIVFEITLIKLPQTIRGSPLKRKATILKL